MRNFNDYTILGILGILLFCLPLLGQQELRVSGYVVDGESGQPVPYATVGVPEQQVGISANINGYFNLQLKEINSSHHLQISSIGYERLSVSFSDIAWDSEQQFVLDPRTTILEEIVIRGQQQTPQQLVASTSKNRKRYLRSTPYLMHGFYRETLQLQDRYQGITEAQGIFYINGYDPRFKNNQNPVMTYDVAQWKQMRRNHYPEAGYLKVGKLLKAKDYYLYDGPLQKQNLEKFKFTVEDSTQYLERMVLVVNFEPLAAYQQELNYRGKMMIKEDDQALLALEVEHLGPLPFLKEKEGEDQLNSHFSISFLYFEGQYYLKRSSFEQNLVKGNVPTRITTEIIGGSFTDQKATFLNNAQRTVLYSDMLNPQIHYDPEFWKNYRYASNELLRQLADSGDDLEKEFQQNDQMRLVPLPEGFENYEQMVNDQNLLDFFMQY